MLRLTLLVAAATIGLCTAYGPHYAFFPEDNILNCMVPNPRAGQRDQNDTKPEEIPVLSFRVVYRPGFGSWFQPVPSLARSPVNGPFPEPLIRTLMDRIGSELNTQLSNPFESRPSDVGLTVAGDLIPLRITTGGDGLGPIVEKLQDRTAEVEERLDELGITDLDERQSVIDAVTTLNSNCSVVGSWTRLPVGKFFPEWIYASYCPESGCSLPPGLTCQPVVKPEAILHTVFLMWDCCFSLVNRRWEWQCGWRRVRLAYMSRCDCACAIQYINDRLYNSVGVALPTRP